MSADSGGPAFPQLDVYTGADHRAGWPVTEGGMSLRDYFAAKAMQGMCLGSNVGDEWVGYMENSDYSGLARHAYAMADAMLEARK